MPTIVDNQALATEVVLSQRVVTTEFRILEIHENVRDRFVRVEVELGPFVSLEMPDGRIEVRGSGRRGINVWDGDEYDAVRDTWRNEDLLAIVSSKF